MPKQQTKSRPPQPAKLRRSTAGLIAEPSLDMSEHHETLVGLVDPFSPQAGSARVPDLGAGRTMAEQVRFTLPITSEASGNAIFAVVPKINNVVLAASGSLWAANYSTTVTTSLLATYGDRFRITSFGARLVSLLAATTSSGYLAVCTGPTPELGGTVVISPDYYYEYALYSVGDDSDWHIVSKPTGSQSLEWNDSLLEDGATEKPIEGWQSLYFIAQGLPATTASFQLEIVINYEFTFRANSAVAKLATPQPLYDPQMLVARNHAHNNISHVVKGAQDKIRGHIKREAAKAVTKHVLPFVKKKGLKMLAKTLL